MSRLQQPDPAARDVDLDLFAIADPPDAEPDAPVPDGDFDDLLAQIGDRELGGAGEVDRVGADAQLGAGLRVGAHRYAARDRVVDLGVGPRLLARPAKTDLT